MRLESRDLENFIEKTLVFALNLFFISLPFPQKIQEVAKYFLIVIWLVWVVKYSEKNRLMLNNSSVVFLFFIGWFFLSLVLNYSSESVRLLPKFFSLFILFFIGSSLFRLPRFRQSFKWAVLGLIVSLVYASLQYFGGFNLAQITNIPLAEYQKGELPGGFFDTPLSNIYYLLASWFLLVSLLNGKMVVRAFITFLAFIVLIALVLWGSLFFLVAYVLLLTAFSFIILGWAKGIAIFILMSSLFVILLKQPNIRSFSNIDKESLTMEKRTEIYRSGWQMLLSHPVVGIGPGNFSKEIGSFLSRNGVNRADFSLINHLSNNFLVLGVLLGFPGIFLFIIFYAFVIKEGAESYFVTRKIYPKKNENIHLLMLFSSLTIVIIGFFDYTIFASGTGELFWIASGVAVAGSI